MTTATVRLWGTDIGYISMSEDESHARFEYDPGFARLKVEPAPLMMPVQIGKIYQFTELDSRSFHGLPGMIADSLPDKYGNNLIDVWLAQTGRSPDEFNAVDRLCYTGTRGMGALEFEPSERPDMREGQLLQIEQLTELASMAFASKETLDATLNENYNDGNEKNLLDILSVGTSAGGARAKAVIAFNPKTKNIRSGQTELRNGYEHWLIKFDGTKFSGDWGIADPGGYGLLEFSYYKIARECGIDMMESRIFSENGRNHFMTRRFDRGNNNTKMFVQTFGALMHFDYYESGNYSYEQLFLAMKKLGMSKKPMKEQFRRMIFNLVGCNQDDHVKNFSFIMDRNGDWSISPAYDLCHSEGSDFTRNHQLSINGKTNNFVKQDIKHMEEYAGLPQGEGNRVLKRTINAFTKWEHLAKELEIPQELIHHVLRTLRLNWN